MARQGYYIITAEQARILDILRISYETLGNKYCVSDWQAVINQIDEIVWADGDVTEQEGAYLDAMSDFEEYMYWSTEAHSWSPAL